MGPLLTLKVHELLRAAASSVECSLDLDRTKSMVNVDDAGWILNGRHTSHPTPMPNAKANCFTTPAPPTNLPVAAMCRMKLQNDCILQDFLPN